MSLRLSYRQEPKYMVVEMGGEFTARSAQEAFDAMHDVAQKRGLTQLLVDARGVSRVDSELTRFLAGEYWAEILRPPFRASFIMRPDLYNGFAETVAQNRGAKVAAFLEEEKAVEWLGQK